MKFRSCCFALRTAGRRPVLLGALVLLAGCSTAAPKEELRLGPPKVAQLPVEPAYSRLTWGHFPRPLPQKSDSDAPLFTPRLSVEMKHVELREALQAVARTIGYRWSYPESVSKRRVTVKVTGTIEEILAAVGREGKVSTELDHENRLVKVVDVEQVSPQLPGAKATNPSG